MGRKGILLISLMLIFLTGGRGRAGEAEDRTAAAKKLYELGMGRFQLDEFDAAIAYWEEGFRNRPAPEFLYNIAQAQRRARRPDKALAFYQKYLSMSPDAENRVEVERIMATLQPATGTTAPAGAQLTVTNSGGPPPDKPLIKKPWFWAVVGGGAAVVATAVAVGVVVGGHKPAHDPAEELPAIHFGLRF
jgi:tetratricopeptide (TPR) repeat protein